PRLTPPRQKARGHQTCDTRRQVEKREHKPEAQRRSTIRTSATSNNATSTYVAVGCFALRFGSRSINRVMLTLGLPVGSSLAAVGPSGCGCTRTQDAPLD